MRSVQTQFGLLVYHFISPGRAQMISGATESPTAILKLDVSFFRQKMVKGSSCLGEFSALHCLVVNTVFLVFLGCHLVL